jgi:hypothetical protein
MKLLIRERENAVKLARYHLANKTGSSELAKYVLSLCDDLAELERFGRVAACGRDVTDLPALWDESDLRLFRISVPQTAFEELEETAKKSRTTVQNVAALTIFLGQDVRRRRRYEED